MYVTVWAFFSDCSQPHPLLFFLLVTCMARSFACYLVLCYVCVRDSMCKIKRVRWFNQAQFCHIKYTHIQANVFVVEIFRNLIRLWVIVVPITICFKHILTACMHCLYMHVCESVCVYVSASKFSWHWMPYLLGSCTHILATPCG